VFQAEVHIVSTITNQANGKVVYTETSNVQQFSGAEPNPDGTFTQVITYAGLNSRVYTDHSSVLVKDVGLIAFETTYDEDGNVIDVKTVIHGQFSEDESAFCEAIVSAIG
jgi:hypothetical protein